MSRQIAAALTPSGRMSVAYGRVLCRDIPDDRFARLPKGVATNHPAFCVGHVTLYAERVLQMINRPELARSDPELERVFGKDAVCLDDPQGTIYPSKQAVVGRFVERFGVALEALSSADDELLGAPNPIERMTDRLPTLGSLLGFYIGGHAMTHLGQLSAWRRMEGMGSAM
jgi:hypothetical protein